MLGLAVHRRRRKEGRLLNAGVVCPVALLFELQMMMMMMPRWMDGIAAICGSSKICMYDGIQCEVMDFSVAWKKNFSLHTHTFSFGAQNISPPFQKTLVLFVI